MPEFHTLSATELTEGLRAQRWSSEALTRHFLERIERLNPQLHAVHFVYKDAVAQAKKIDQRRQQGESLPPLAGLPMTLKDAFAIKGKRSTYGALPYAYHTPKKDAACVASLKRAGVVIMGRSAVPTGSFDWNCRNQLFAECVHPEHPEFSPGGSSGGAASALGAGLTPLELGSDLGGSIRYPAHCCGLYGLRTSEGWIPFADVGPDGQGSFAHVGVCGPMSRHIEDLSLITERFARDFPDSRLRTPEPKATLRIAYSAGVGNVPADAATTAHLDTFIKQLRARGHRCEQISPELDIAALNQTFGHVVGYQYQTMYPAWIPNRLKQQALDQLLFQKVGAGWMRDSVLKGLMSSQADFLQHLARVRSAQHVMDRFFNTYDMWILPVSPGPTRKRSESGHMMDTHAGPMSYSDFISSYLCSTALLGTPALSVPVGRDENDLPIGLQIHGPRFGDLALLHQFSHNLGF